ncbi:MAG: gliding motility-associated C-terminal domain-containing protein, partial [Flammeovirgaceae bacterium]|nr:gliding motility-associated C-terminal domain-containing protein [Flammeovirgaceae bacterium]
KYAGQTFFLQFPPVEVNGEQFINSSPRLFPPLNDYACPGKRFYYADFAGTDDDGDSLAYSIVEPLSTKDPVAIPANGPGAWPFPTVIWKPGFSLDNILNGDPDLEVSADGLLTVSPTTPGLYVFAVKVDEFRKGVKIGEVRRDFQMLVVDNCPVPDPPLILGKKSNEASFTHKDYMSVSFTNSVADEERCIQVRITDTDALKETENFQERVRIKAIPLNFRADVSDVLPEITSALLTPDNSSVIFNICFPECPFIQGAPYQVGIVAYDDACALPLFDTLRISVDIQPPPNQVPYFVNQTFIDVLVNEGDLIDWDIIARDDDGDTLTIGLVNDGFLFQDVGMEYNVIGQVPGEYQSNLIWDSRCDVYDFTQKTEFNIQVIVDDNDKCRINNQTPTTFRLRIKLPGNADPLIDSDLTPIVNEDSVYTEVKIFETLNFNVHASDSDQDVIKLKVGGKDFNPGNVGVQVQQPFGSGFVTTPFSWSLDCSMVDLSVKDEFEFQFIVIDTTNKCRFYKADTLDVVVKVLPPDNDSPDLTITSLNDLELVNNSVELFHDQTLKLGLAGEDADINPQDVVSITLPAIETENTPPANYQFSATSGISSADGTFEWTPSCNIFEESVFQNQYRFLFVVNDDRCFSELTDTVKIDVVIKDYENDEVDFLPANFISPNGDGCNDYFAMENFEAQPGSLCDVPENVKNFSLPLDNCRGQFVGIRIMNRWGREVFKSFKRDFRWYAQDQAAGVYYYYLTFSNREYKGSLSVRF